MRYKPWPKYRALGAAASFDGHRTGGRLQQQFRRLHQRQQLQRRPGRPAKLWPRRTSRCAWGPAASRAWTGRSARARCCSPSPRKRAGSPSSSATTTRRPRPSATSACSFRTNATSSWSSTASRPPIRSWRSSSRRPRFPAITYDIAQKGWYFVGIDNLKAGIEGGETFGQWIKQQWNCDPDAVVASQGYNGGHRQHPAYRRHGHRRA